MTEQQTIRSTLIGCLVLAAFVAVVAQVPDQTPAGPPKPAPTELVKLRAEFVNVAEQLATAKAQLSICQGQLAPTLLKQHLAEVEAERKKVLDAFEQANPGWTIDLRTLVVSKKGG